MIIGVAGFARSGKDSVADVLVNGYGFTKLRFADSIREALATLDPYLVGTNGSTVRLSPALNIYRPHGTLHEQFEALKSSPFTDEVRRLLQVFGTEVGRDQFGRDFWVETGLNAASEIDGHVVIPDVRFHNEADIIGHQAGFVIRVSRPGVEALNAHPSEIFVPELRVKYDLVNDGSLDDLGELVHMIMDYDEEWLAARDLKLIFG